MNFQSTFKFAASFQAIKQVFKLNYSEFRGKKSIIFQEKNLLSDLVADLVLDRG
jgi:hypothetical protein